MENLTPRFGLPQLVVAQAHKEITHNEALALLDALLHPVVEGKVTTPPAVMSEDAGKCWLVGSAATGTFADKDDEIAYWTGGSWRFCAPSDGMRLWNRANQRQICYLDQQWTESTAVAAPSGGAVIDQEARAVLAALIAQLTETAILPAS